MKSKSSGTFPADHMWQLIIHTASPKMDMSPHATTHEERFLLCRQTLWTGEMINWVTFWLILPQFFAQISYSSLDLLANRLMGALCCDQRSDQVFRWVRRRWNSNGGCAAALVNMVYSFFIYQFMHLFSLSTSLVLQYKHASACNPGCRF